MERTAAGAYPAARLRKERAMSCRTLTLVKGGQKYIFRYSPGMENPIVDEIVRLAEDPQTNLDWLDAATLSFQVAQGAAIEAYRVMVPVPPADE